MIRLIASDLDGTLLDAQKRIPDPFFDMVPLLKEKGVHFVAASGRSLFTLKQNFARCESDIDYLCDNGAVVSIGGKVMFEHALEPELVRGVIEKLSQLPNVCALLCTDRATYHLPTQGTPFSPHIDPYYINQVEVADLCTVTDPVFKIAVCDLAGPQNNAYPVISGQFGERASVLISGDVWFDVMKKGVGKGLALQEIQQFYGITPEETMVFGDNYNDVDMFPLAKESYAVENAAEGVRSLASAVCKANTEWGVLHTIADRIFDQSMIQLLGWARK